MLKKAFTLIELLVVIAIIPLLLSVVMPGLQRAKARAKTVNLAGKIVLLEEYDWQGCNFGSFIMTPPEIKWNDPLTVWHGGTSAFTFADGHTEFKKWAPETVENFTKDPPEWGYIPTTDGGIEDVKWMLKGWSRAKGRQGNMNRQPRALFHNQFSAQNGYDLTQDGLLSKRFFG